MSRDRLLVLRRATRLEAASPEHRYLATLVLARARRVFRDVTSVDAVAGDDPTATWDDALAGLADDVPVLVVDGGNLYLGDGSLAPMAAALEDGADVVVPGALESFARVAELPEIFTLRGFEEVESSLLGEGDEPRQPAESLPPVAVYRAAVLRRLVDAHGWYRVLDDATLLGRTDGVRVVRLGVYHPFADYWGQAREDILPFIPAGAKDVLEVGCARGLTGALIQERLGCRVTGVELNPEAATEARTRLHRVLEGDVEEIDVGGPYDAVVATELFEHLRYPERVLQRMRSVLRPKGRIVLSVPNVGHHSIVRDLLEGRWDYLPIGLLCYTHFRFFTRSTLEDWLRGAGFDRFEITPQLTSDDPMIEGVSRVAIDRQSLRTKGFYLSIAP